MRKIFLTVTLAAMAAGVSAQEGVVNFMNLGCRGIHDINQLATAYLTPYGRAFSTTLSSGWFNTAKPHRLFGFDISIGGTLTMVPEIDRSFNLSDYQWDVLYYNHSGNAISPTIAGRQDELLDVGFRTKLYEGGPTYTVENILKMPQGIGLATVGLPIVNAGIGLVAGTDLQLRVLPPLDLGSYGSLFVLGGGLRHDFKQWIPVVKKLPFDASFEVNYSIVNSSFDNVKYFPTQMGLDINDFAAIDDHIRIIANDPNRIKSEFYDKQQLAFKMRAFSANLIVSKELLFLTVFGSVGYTSSSSSFGLYGPYLLPDVEIDPATDAAGLVLRDRSVVQDPIDVQVKYSDFRASAGLRLKFAMLTIHGEFTYQNYAMFNAGVGISLR